MSEDWQPGDLALCIGRGDDDAFEVWPAERVSMGPIKGLVYTVAAVRLAVDCYGREGVALRLAEIRPKHPLSVGFNAEFFRKFRQRDADEQDAETIRLLNGRPVEPVAAGFARADALARGM